MLSVKKKSHWQSGAGFLPVMVFVLGVCLAAVVALWEKSHVDEAAALEFKAAAEHVFVDVTDRFRLLGYGLASAEAGFVVSQQVTREEFRSFVASLDLPKDYPGVRGFGFIQRVMRPELEYFLAAERADGAPGLALRQLDDNSHEDYYIVKFVEPAANNLGALGLDVGSERVRRAAVEQAVDSGKTVMTEVLALVQDQHKTPGALLLKPVYVNGASAGASDQRRARLLGLVYVPVVMNELFEDVAKAARSYGVQFRLSDGSGNNAASMFGPLESRSNEEPGDGKAGVGRFWTEQTLSVYGRELLLQVNSTTEFDAAVDYVPVWMYFFGISFVAALLAVLVRQQVGQRLRAEDIALEMTQELRLEEVRAKDFSRSNSDWFWETDTQNRYCYIAGNFQQAYGLDPEQLLGVSRTEFLAKLGVRFSAYIAAHMDLIESRKVFKDFEYPIRLEDGSERWISVSGVPFLDEHGQFAGYRGTGTIITQRKQQEAQSAELSRQVAELNQRFELAAEAAHLGVWDYDVVRNIVVWDKWMFALYGLKAEGFLGAYQAWQNGLHPDDRERGDREIQQALSGEKDFDTRFRVVWPNGEIRHIKADAVVLRDEEGHPLRMIGVNYDITDLQRKEDELAEERRRLADIISGTNVGTWEWNVQTGATVFNERWANIVGYTLEELSPLSIDTWAQLVFPEDARHSEELLEKHFKGELSHYDCEARMRHKDGHWVWGHDRGRVSSWTADGKPLLMSGTHQDISQRKANEQALEEARAQAESANVAKSRFLATMSHEIRTPMNGILGMAQLLLMPNVSTEERLDYSRTIFNSGKTLLALLNDILDLSKVEAGKMELEILPFDPAQLLHETKALFAETARQKGLLVSTRWRGRAGERYHGDPHRLQQMLSNLVGNAIKFTAQGEINIEAGLVGGEDTECVLEFSVADTGIGIARDKQPQVFHPFSQVDNSTTRQFGGTGLGLSIVRSLARLMGGDVGVESEIGKGARFWFRIRAVRLGFGEEARSSSRVESEAVESTGGSKSFSGRILVVEDVPTNRMVLAALLERLGLSVAMAKDGKEAVDVVTGGDVFDLVLMDVQMPVMDGYMATREIRRWEAEGQRTPLPIVALTADAYEDDKKRCFAAGMDDYLAKPVEFNKVRSVLNRWLKPDEVESAREDAPPAAHEPDVVRVIALFEELSPLMAQNKYAAIGRFKALQALADGTPLAVEVAEAGRLLAEMRFDAALGQLRKIAEDRQWTVEWRFA